MKFADVALVSAVSFGLALAACGGGGEAAPEPQVPTAPTPTTSPTTAEVPTTAPTATGTAPPPATEHPPVKGHMKPIVPSAMAAELKAIGLDPKALPPLSKMEPDKIRKVMSTFKKALGVKCDACHDQNDFRAWTPNKRVAAGMWDQFVRGLAMEDGSLLYCDSCHQGAMHILDRTDKKALAGWMETSYVGKLKLKAKDVEHGCGTCHGDPFEPKFLAAWEKEKPKK